MLARMARASGLMAREFTAAAPFLAEVTNSNPDLIILDLALGRVDAIDIMRRLERLPYKGHVVLISGHSGEILSDAERIGARRGLRMLPSLQKPFRIHQFNTILKLLDQAPLESKARPSLPAPEDSLKIDFKEALGNRWLEVWYQPKFDLRSLSVCGAEALVRMRHPAHGVLRPAQFLPPPDDPLHLSLAKAVLKRVMLDWREFVRADLTLKMAVNVPVTAVSSGEFVPFVRAALPQDERFPGLILEMTESQAINNPDTVRELATQLRIDNVALSIDDFGSNYGWLWRLTEAPLGELKLDGKFVQGCSSDKQKRRLCRTVVELGHEFGACVSAEAVEDAVDLHALIEMGCDMAQGFLFAEPMPPDELVRFLMSSPSRSVAKDAAVRAASLASLALATGRSAEADVAT